MDTRRIARTIATILSFMVFVVILAACDNEQGMMHGSNSTGMANWNWLQILVSLGLGILLGFLLGKFVTKRK